MTEPTVIYPPTSPREAMQTFNCNVFLGGSISKNKGDEVRALGDAEDWQKRLIAELPNLPVTWFNPRNKSGVWNPDTKMVIDDPDFKAQVVWELAAQEQADILVYYFDAEAKAPIVLMELGCFGARCYDDSDNPQVIVYCPEGFWRKGNVDIFCERYDIPCYSDRGAFVNALTTLIEETLEEIN